MGSVRPGAPPAALLAARAAGDTAALPLLAALAVVSVMLLAALAVDVVRLRHAKARARPCGVLGVRRARVALSKAVGTPSAVGYFHPAVLVPRGFADRVDAAEWEAVLAHEGAHLTRRDDWAKALQSALLRVAWWMPGLWLLDRQLDLERELASDEHAARGTGSRRYAACLLRLASDTCGVPLAPALGGRRSQVAIRVERLLRPLPEPGPLVRAAALGAFTAVVLGALLAAVFAVPSRQPVPHAALPARRAPRVASVLAGHKGAVRRAPVGGVRGRAASPPPSLARSHSAVAHVPGERVSSRRPTVVAALLRPPAAQTRMSRPPGSAAALKAAAFPAAAGLLGPGIAAARARHCPTCFAPFGVPGEAPDSAAAANAGAPAAVAAGEESGPVDLSGSLIWTLRAVPPLSVAGSTGG